MKKELLFLIVVAFCLLSITVFMIGGIVQDVDYHELASIEDLEAQKAEYDALQQRKYFGETLQLAGLVMTLIGFIMITVLSIVTGIAGTEKNKTVVKKD